VSSFVHTIRPRYAEVDMQGVVFNAHWLTYFDEACTRFFEWMGYRPQEAFFEDFDVMVVKTVIEWSGPAGFDDLVDIRTEPIRLGTKSFDLRFTATVEDIIVQAARRAQQVGSDRAALMTPIAADKVA